MRATVRHRHFAVAGRFTVVARLPWRSASGMPLLVIWATASSIIAMLRSNGRPRSDRLLDDHDRLARDHFQTSARKVYSSEKMVAHAEGNPLPRGKVCFRIYPAMSLRTFCQ